MPTAQQNDAVGEHGGRGQILPFDFAVPAEIRVGGLEHQFPPTVVDGNLKLHNL